MRYKLTRIVTEPLTQFLLIGVAIYAAYGFFGTPDNTDNERTVTVTAGEIQAMASQWLKLWSGTPPIPKNLRRPIYIRLPMFYSTPTNAMQPHWRMRQHRSVLDTTAG